MRTISEAVNERLSQVRNNKEVKRNDVIRVVYEKFPKLRQIDADLVQTRAERLIASIERDEDPIKALNKREEDLLEERKEFLIKNNIRDDFDEESVVCGSCNDTGYIKTKSGRTVVCRDCMIDAITEVFNESGLADFTTYDMKSFKLDYYKDDNGDRINKFKKLQSIIDGKGNNSVWILTGNVSSGKTYLAVVCCKYAILQGYSAHYLKADKLYELKPEEISDLKTYDFIVVDDYAPEITNVYKNATNLHSLLEARMASDLPTVIVSSSSLAAIVEGSEERIAGKLRGAEVL